MFFTLMSLKDRLRLKLKVKTKISLCMAIMLDNPWQSLYTQYYRTVRYRDCIKSRRDMIRITRHIMMHQVLYNVHVTLFIGQLHNIQKICNLEREYRDCIKSRRDKIRITRHIMIHQVLCNVHVTVFVGQLHNI